MFVNEHPPCFNSSATARFTKLAVWAGLALLAMAGAASAQSNGGCPTSAINIKVDCDKNQTINAALACASYNSRPVTLDVYGTCKENVVIQSADRITLTGHNGASIVDQSNGANDTVGIYFSSLITVQDLTIVGGNAGVDCAELSSCRLENSIVQNANNALVLRSRSAVEGANNTFQNNTGFGVWVTNGATWISIGDMVIGNADDGIRIVNADVIALGDTIKNNTGDGINARNNARLRVSDLTITGNGVNGVELNSAATMEWFDGQGSVVTGNGQHGVVVGNQVNTVFSGIDNVSGNQAQPDVDCYGLYWVATNVDTVGGTTNCLQAGKQKEK